MSLHEFILSSIEPEDIRSSGPFAIRPVVVEANALVSDVYYAAARTHSSMPPTSARHGRAPLAQRQRSSL